MNHRTKGGRIFIVALTVFLIVGAMVPTAQAVPALQLDIDGGFYDTTTQSIMTSADTFSLYALLDPTARGVSATETYYISVALSPLTSSSASLGSFAFNGTDVNVTSGMTFGRPPIEVGGLATSDPGDLAPHGMYPTYFREFSFTFNPLNTSAIYNTQDNPGGVQTGSGLLYAAFQVDRTLLNSPYQLHFDLYNESFRNGDTDINRFAPFSHDAGTTTRGVPEPSTALFLAVGLLGLGFWQWRNHSAFGA